VGEALSPDELVAERPEWSEPIRTLMPTLLGLVGAEHGAGPASARPSGEREARGRKVSGDFRIVREIGRGRMGVVYEAEQVPLGRRVALNVMSVAASLDPRSVQRDQHEALVVGLLQHRHILPIHVVGFESQGVEQPHGRRELRLRRGAVPFTCDELRRGLQGHGVIRVKIVRGEELE
jgi:serine/threonine protein kinase